MAHQIDPQVHECIDRCQSCQAICLETVYHCLEIGGKHAESDHIRMLLACAEICKRAIHAVGFEATLANMRGLR